MDIDVKNLSPEKKNMLLFMMLVQQHEQIARMNLGEVPNPVHNQKEEDLQAARYAIDTLEMLRSYTDGNISAEARQYLDSVCEKLGNSLKTKDETRKKEQENSSEEG
ncbi:MAG: DUF1844 domain-containing protein [Cyclonatronaceae bacterium]